MSPFVRATRPYDVETGEPIAFDWATLQPIEESQAEIERAVKAIETDGGRCRR